MPVGTPTLIGTGFTFTGSMTITTTANIVAGDLVVIAINTRNFPTITVSSVSDGTNTYLFLSSVTEPNGSHEEIWYKNNCLAVSSGATITITLSAVPFAANAIASSTSGIGTTTPIVSLTASNNSASATTLTCVAGPFDMGEILSFGATEYGATGAYTESAGFTNLNVNTSGIITTLTLGYAIASTSNAISFSPSVVSPTSMCVLQCTFYISPKFVSKEYALTEPVRSWTRMVGY